MDVLVSYDVATGDAVGRRRLRKVAKVCVGFGQRVQKSVFECSVNEMQMEQLRDRLVKCIDEKKDSLRIYRLVEPREKHVESFGRDAYVDFDGPLVV
ncbi:MAG: CRISPR-associated endonuclease Cas2 [Terriglobia bacterium]|jgi:CRISPR-associated protein Cas2